MVAHGIYFSIIHDDNLVCIHDRRHPLGDDDLGGVGNIFLKTISDQLVCLGVYGRSRVIQDEDFWAF